MDVGGTEIGVDQQRGLAGGAGNAQYQLGGETGFTFVRYGTGDGEDLQGLPRIRKYQASPQAVDTLLVQLQRSATASPRFRTRDGVAYGQSSHLGQHRNVPQTLQLAGIVDTADACFPEHGGSHRKYRAQQRRQGQKLNGIPLGGFVGGFGPPQRHDASGARLSVCNVMMRSAMISKIRSRCVSSLLVNSSSRERSPDEPAFFSCCS